MVYPFKVGPYARNVYIYGNMKFTDVPTEYHQPVKEYAAKNFTQYQIDEALSLGFITQQEYDETIILIATT